MDSTSSALGDDVCPHCGQRLRKFSIPSLHGGEGRLITVECDCEGAIEERTREDRAARACTLRSAWERTGVPRRYLDVKPDMGMLRLIDDGKGIYLYGPRGTGKTHAACSILKAYVSRHTSEAGWCSARFVSTPAWLDSIQDTYGRWSSSEDAFQRAAGVKLLVLDDIGKVTSRVSDWSAGKLFRLVNDRYGDGKVTVFTSRYQLADLASRMSTYEDRETAGDMVDRIAETCVPLMMDGPNLRRNA